jgi:two-component system, response regulator RegA
LKSSKILIVDDQYGIRVLLDEVFRKEGYQTYQAANGKQALELVQNHEPDLVILDMKIPGMDGLDILKHVKAIDPSTSIVVLTGYGSIATALESVRLGAVHYLTKPTDADRILAAFQHGLAARPRDLPMDPPSLARVEWEHLNRVLTDCDGNVSEAARQLGMHRRSLQRKLSKYPGAR